MWLVIMYGPNGYDTEVEEFDNYEQAFRAYGEMVKKVNEKWIGKIVLSNVERGNYFPRIFDPNKLKSPNVFFCSSNP